ncbi:MAG: hypothetical protein RIC52_07930, partial [Amphiplicatus sp.]
MKRRRLSPEEKALWKKVTRDVRPVAPVAIPDEPSMDEGGLANPAPPSVAARPKLPLPVLEPAKKARKPRSPASPFEAGGRSGLVLLFGWLKVGKRELRSRGNRRRRRVLQPAFVHRRII